MSNNEVKSMNNHEHKLMTSLSSPSSSPCTTNTTPLITTTSPSQSIVSSAAATSSSAAPIVDSQFISSWLDQHPQFLTDYLRKMQLARRHTIMNDQTGQLLANLYSNLRLQPHSISCDNSAGLNSTISPNGQITSSTHTPMTTSVHSRATTPTSEYKATSRILKEVEQLFHVDHNNTFELDCLDEQPNKKNIIISTNEIDCNINTDKNTNEMPYQTRKQFKELSLYEKMYALVKTLYQSLDLKTTCKKILKTVSLLLDADRCSLFLVVDDDEYDCKKALVSVVFDAQSLGKQIISSNTDTNVTVNDNNNSTDLKNDRLNSNGSSNESKLAIDSVNNASERIKLPYGIGIAGYVASTGVPLNIPNAYLDDRFNSSIDKQTGYKTKSILCLPILNELGECIAVAEAINKLGDDDSVISFTNKDEEIFAKFMPFIAIAIRNSNLYAKSRKEAFINKILLELATIVFDEQTTVDNLVSRIICHALFLLECEHCQMILLHDYSKKTKIKQSHKLFERVYELHHSELPTDPFSYAVSLKPVSSHSARFPIDLNVLNTVIQTGELKTLNSLLGIPVRNNNDQVVAVIFAYNKLKNDSYNFFTSHDINAAKAFALFCGIGIQNIMMYEKVVRAMNMQQVAFDVLSYHASSSYDEVKKLVNETIPEPVDLSLQLFSFDEQTLDDISTLKACISMFCDLDLNDKFNIPHETLCHFFMTVKKNYRPVAYHNWRHGFNVMTSMYTIITQGKYRPYFSDLEILSLLIACICHDVDHRGTTNTFQIKIQSPLAKLYTTSTMEHHHFNQCIMILHSNVNNILINLSQSEYSAAMDMIEKAILATDLSLHFEKVDTFLRKANNPDERNFDSHEDKDLLISMLMTGCDLSGSTKPWNCHYRLSNLVSKEFFEQGDLEKEKFNNEPIDMMNRNKKDQLPQMQVQFLQSVCLPLYNGLSLCNQLLKPLADQCESNLNEWKKLFSQDK